jgi:serine/threonine-protein kinase
MSPLSPEHPRQLGPYRIVKLLGEGSFGWVFEAVESPPTQPPGPVAVKVLKPNWAADAEVTRRFKRECDSQAGLQHSHIVAALGSGHDPVAGRYYLVMRLVEGPGLDAVLAGGPVDPVFAATAALHVARALDHATKAGVAHRDVKAANVLIDTTERKGLVTDFSMVFCKEAAVLTAAGQALGSPPYMAPEIIGKYQPPADRGERLRYYALADQYSLGILLYEMLAGRVPFAGDRQELLSHHLRRQPPSLGRDVPAELGRIALRMLEKDAEKRFKDFGEVAARLWGWLADQRDGGSRNELPLLPPPRGRAEASRNPTRHGKRGWFFG